MRSRSRVGWRARVSTALAVVAGQPSLWAIGALGFALRGGMFLLVATVVVLPTPVELRLLIGTNLSSSGFRPEFLGLVLGAAGVFGLAVLVALAASAYAELVAFERLVRHPETADQRGGREPLVLGRRQRLALVAGVFLLEVAALVLLAVAALPLISSVIELTYSEIVRPSVGGTIYVRVLNGVREPLVFLIVAAVFIEMIYSSASRRLLVRGFGLARGAPRGKFWPAGRALPSIVAGALARPVLHPIRTTLTMLLVWGGSLLVLLPAAWGIGTAWSALRGTYLARTSRVEIAELTALAVVTLGLAAMWVVGLLLAGFSSALRAALWSVEELG